MLLASGGAVIVGAAWSMEGGMNVPVGVGALVEVGVIGVLVGVGA